MKAQSEDLIICREIDSIVSGLGRLNIEYGVIGSCGMQSYLKHCFRLPRDLDIVSHPKQLPLLKSYATENKYVFNEDTGRATIVRPFFNIHILFDSFYSIDRSNNTIIGKIDLVPYFAARTTRPLNMVFSELHPRFPVFPFEIVFLIDIIRTPYSDSLATHYFIFSNIVFDMNRMKVVLAGNRVFLPIVWQRITTYLSVLRSGGIFDSSGSKIVIDRMEIFLGVVESLSMEQ